MYDSSIEAGKEYNQHPDWIQFKLAAILILRIMLYKFGKK